MQIVKSLSEIENMGATSIALGNFDGIHIGHRAVLSDAIRIARERGIKSLCYTFSNHPANFIMNKNAADEGAVKLICTEEQKITILDEMGFDILVNVPFDESIMTMSAQNFIDDILADTLHAESISVGFNYSFGVRAEGTTTMLKNECKKLGISVNVHDAVMLDDVIVSSTEIRRLITQGDMETATRFLGWEVGIGGIVEHGKSIGKKGGFPTMNIPAPADRVLPPNGVYFSRTVINGVSYDSISNIGVKPTVGLNSKNIETHIFDFNQNVYDCNVTVYLQKFRRGEVKFADKDSLFRQISSDSEAARKWHSDRKKLENKN